jgi:predicted alpha/beta-fold hydrolase
VQTIWSAKFAHPLDGPPLSFERQRWTTPDADFIDVDVLPAAAAATAGRPAHPMVVMFHGLEGSSGSHYAQALGAWCRARGLALAVPHFRGCSGELNLAPRAYHSGDFEEIGWILGQMRQRFGAPLVALGVSLGGNALLRWAQEAGDSAGRLVNAVASVCAPLDLTAAGLNLGQGFNRWVYTRMFLNTLKPKALAKWRQHPGLFDRVRMLASRSLYEFDDVVTGPLHGFSGVDDYWHRASAKPHLHRIRVPALVVNALNDPFVPAHSLPAQCELGDMVQLWQPAHGGHVGFSAGRFPGHLRTVPDTVAGWLVQHG